MTMRQNLLIRWGLMKMTFRHRRRLTKQEVNEVTAKVINEAQILYALIGAITVVWAEIELHLDVVNGILVLQPEMAGTKVPMMLERKIDVFQKSFAKIPKVAHLVERAQKLVGQLNELKTIRHDIIHGTAMGMTELSTREFLRVAYKGTELTFWYESYGFPAMTAAMQEMGIVRGELFALFRDLLTLVSPDAAKQTFG